MTCLPGSRTGILPRNGRNIKFSELHDAIQKTYNIAVPFSHFLPRGAAQLLTRDLARDSFDLSDVSVHNMIEHDASFCRKHPFSPASALPRW